MHYQMQFIQVKHYMHYQHYQFESAFKFSVFKFPAYVLN